MRRALPPLLLTALSVKLASILTLSPLNVRRPVLLGTLGTQPLDSVSSAPTLIVWIAPLIKASVPLVLLLTGTT